MIPRRKPLPRPSKPIKRSRIKRHARKPSETVRIYGPPARREWVKTLPCAACGVVGCSENAHCAPPSEKGTGYKADAKWIAPLCGPQGGDLGYIGCHTLYDEHYETFVNRYPELNMQECAATVEQCWPTALAA